MSESVPAAVYVCGLQLTVVRSVMLSSINDSVIYGNLCSFVSYLTGPFMIIHRVQEKKEASSFSTISLAFLDRFS